MKKKAFTLVEVLIVLAIVGIVTTFALNIFKNHDKGTRYLYSNVFNSLDRAIYNAGNYTDMPNPFEKEGAEGVGRLCRMLIYYINPVDRGASCSVDANHMISLGNLTMANGVDGSHIEFTTKSPLFTATNGVSYYIAPMRIIKEGEEVEEGEEDERVDLVRYYIVFADLNNNKGPNSLRYARGAEIEPDIYAFAVLDINRVCPLGPPEIDERFMLTRITYQILNNSGNESSAMLAFSKPSKAYYLSKAEAWGYYLNGNNDDDIIEGNPLSYNDIIRHDGIGNTMVYSGIDELANVLARYNSQMTQSGGAAVSLRGTTYNPDNRQYGCERMSDEACGISIDRYVY